MPAQGRRSSRLSPVTPSPRAAWNLLGAPDGLGDRLRAAADALGAADEVEAAWLRGAADLVERGEADRRATRSEALWLEELALEARAHKVWLLAGWVNAAEALRSAIHAHESERGPLVEALFPAWRGASLRRHLDQALAAEAELQRRLTSGYVVRRLAELSTRSAVGPALEALAAAGAAWAAERERPALAGTKANEVRDGLLAAAREAAHLLERVRWLARAALARRPELLEVVFPKRAHSTGRETTPSGVGASDEASGTPAEGGSDVAAEIAPATSSTTGPGAAREDASSRDGSSTAPAPDLVEHPRRGAPRRQPTEDAVAPRPDLAEGTRRRAPRKRSTEDAEAPAADLAERTRRPAPRKRSTEDAEAPVPDLVERTRRRSPPQRPSDDAEAPAPDLRNHTRRRAPRRRPARDGGAQIAPPPKKTARAPHAGASRRRPPTAHAEPAPTPGATRRGSRHRPRPPRRS